uniref:Rho/rac guanine nucleotide exchange factor (GEF) 18b n=1 Tax=Neogobius melanostomus TaxID=47308 RepID=A0A8C6U4W8_9GOBI
MYSCGLHRSLPGEMDETDALRSKRYNDDVISLAPSTADSIIVEDAHYAAVRADLESDAQDLEAESWSSAVDPQFVKKHSKENVKRQDVIYELMQTEMHHVRTLKIMLRVYVRELKENLQMDSGRLDCLFPRLENLLELHTHFLSRLKERRRENFESLSDRNYLISSVADILIAQFSGEIGEKMKDSYGDFCSHHSEAVSYYKEQLQNNKKFHSTIRKINNMSIVRRLGVTECILLVTQRITKYPVLVERILHNTEAGTQEHKDLAHALTLIKDTIVQVDTLVNLHEKMSRLRDIYNKMEPKSQGKIKDGRVFRREDLAQGRRRLLHDGTVNWRAASGRLKDILAVLLSDVMILIQEKDQRYVFAAVDNKPSVISLQKLIVREVAHEEKAMFLICASSNEPEMYEIHTSSKEERNTWMTQIRQAVESVKDLVWFYFLFLLERLSQKDAVIVQALSEKLQLFADVAESVAGFENTASRSLLRGDGMDLQQGEALLKGAITEGGVFGPKVFAYFYIWFDFIFQAIIAQQDSQLELQKASLTERASLPSRYRGNCLQEQEKQRTLALQREELASFHKLQVQHRQEQQRWEKEREKHRQQVEANEAKLRQREEECKQLEERLAEEREELERQREKYQEDLERLRESTRAVEKEKERLEHQKKSKRKTIEVMTSVSVSHMYRGFKGLSVGAGACPTGLSELKGLRNSVSVAPSDFPERPEVTLRREVSSSALKTEVPLHLLSTTNQHKSVSVSQQIPTKLAALSSVKGSKQGKSMKASHRSDSTASVDMKQMLPLKLSARDDSSLKAKRSISPHQPLTVSAPPPTLTGTGH